MSTDTYLSIRSWIMSNWSYTNQALAMLCLETQKQNRVSNITEIKQTIVAFMKKQNGFCLVSA